MAEVSKHSLKHDEFVDAAVDASRWIEKNWRLVAVGGAALVCGVLGTVGWLGWQERVGTRAGEELGVALSAYSKAAASGFKDPSELNGILASFEAVAAKAPEPTGSVATFYRGATLHRLGRNDEARAILEEVRSESGLTPTFRATATAMLARVQGDLGQIAEAEALLRGLIADSSLLYPPDEALLAVGWMHARAGNDDAARQAWQELLDQYPKSPATQEVTELLGPRTATP